MEEKLIYWSQIKLLPFMLSRNVGQTEETELYQDCCFLEFDDDNFQSVST